MQLQDLGSVVRQMLTSTPHLRGPGTGDSINSNEAALPVAGIELIPGT